MGLDMYLEKQTYIGNNYREKDEQIKIQMPKSQKKALIKIADGEIKTKRITNITEQVAYWRKANAIHKWFVDNVQEGNDDCESHSVHHDQITTLVGLCEKIIKGTELISGEITTGFTYTKEGGKVANTQKGKILKNPELAQELLPTAEGFFFGSYDYDQYYFDDIKATADQLKPLLKEKGDYYYQSSW